MATERTEGVNIISLWLSLHAFESWSIFHSEMTEHKT